MKRITALLLALVTVFSLMACGKDKEETKPTAPEVTEEPKPFQGDLLALIPESSNFSWDPSQNVVTDYYASVTAVDIETTFTSGYDGYLFDAGYQRVGEEYADSCTYLWRAPLTTNTNMNDYYSTEIAPGQTIYLRTVEYGTVFMVFAGTKLPEQTECWRLAGAPEEYLTVPFEGDFREFVPTLSTYDLQYSHVETGYQFYRMMLRDITEAQVQELITALEEKGFVPGTPKDDAPFLWICILPGVDAEVHIVHKDNKLLVQVSTHDGTIKPERLLLYVEKFEGEENGQPPAQDPTEDPNMPTIDQEAADATDPYKVGFLPFAPDTPFGMALSMSNSINAESIGFGWMTQEHFSGYVSQAQAMGFTEKAESISDTVNGKVYRCYTAYKRFEYGGKPVCLYIRVELYDHYMEVEVGFMLSEHDTWIDDMIASDQT